jgi:hypothetical protein
MFNTRSIVVIQGVLLLSLHRAFVKATPNTTPGTINCTDPSKNRVIGFNILDESQDPTTQGVTTFVGATPYVIDLNNFVNCDMNFRAILDTPVPANCDINNIRCVRFYIGNTTERRDFVTPFTPYLEYGGSGLPIDRTPVPGVQTLKACPYTEPSCKGRPVDCYQVQINVKACNYQVPAPVPVPTPECICPVPAPLPVPLPVPVPVPVEPA